jgi:hypothetical protein
MICDPSSSHPRSTAVTATETARTAIRRTLAGMKGLVLRRACDRAYALAYEPRAVAQTSAQPGPVTAVTKRCSAEISA